MYHLGATKSTLALFNTPILQKVLRRNIGTEKEIPALPKFMGLSRVLLLHICTYVRRTKLGGKKNHLTPQKVMRGEKRSEYPLSITGMQQVPKRMGGQLNNCAIEEGHPRNRRALFWGESWVGHAQSLDIFHVRPICHPLLQHVQWAAHLCVRERSWFISG